jgi:hypothetical protein
LEGKLMQTPLDGFGNTEGVPGLLLGCKVGHNIFVFHLHHTFDPVCDSVNVSLFDFGLRLG